MGRFTAYQGSSKVVNVTAVQTLTFTNNDIDAANAVALMFSWQGAGNTNSDIDIVRVRAGGDLMYECSWGQLQAYQQAYAPRFVSNLDAGVVFTIPLSDLGAPTQAIGDTCQYPPEREIQVEIVTLATTVAGFLIASWVKTTVEAQRWMKYYQKTLNFQASANSQVFPFTEGGRVRGITLPQAGIAQAELFVSGVSAFRVNGPQFGAVTTGDALSEQDYFTDGITITTIKHHKVLLDLAADTGASYLRLDTGAGWAGVTNTAAFYALVDLPKAAA